MFYSLTMFQLGGGQTMGDTLQWWKIYEFSKDPSWPKKT